MTLKILITKEKKDLKLILNGEETKFIGLKAVKKAKEWTSNQIEALVCLANGYTRGTKEIVITVKEK